MFGFDTSVVIAGVTSMFAGAAWVGRIQARVNGHEKIVTNLDKKMDKHMEQSAKQWQDVERSLGRIEGTIGTRIDGEN